MNALQYQQAHGTSQHHLNQDYVLELLADDLALVHSLLTNYLQMSPDEMAGLKLAIEASDTALLKQHAHRLRGLLRYFGAQDLEDMLLEMEVTDAATEHQELQVSYRLFADAARILTQEVQAWLDRLQPSSTCDEGGRVALACDSA